MRARMNRVSLSAETAGEALSEVSHLIGQCIEQGLGEFFPLERAQQIVEGAIADLQFIATETAVPQYEPGHTQKRERKLPPSKPTGGPLL